MITMITGDLQHRLQSGRKAGLNGLNGTSQASLLTSYTTEALDLSKSTVRFQPGEQVELDTRKNMKGTSLVMLFLGFSSVFNGGIFFICPAQKSVLIPQDH